jgi:hypothetical protein
MKSYKRNYLKEHYNIKQTSYNYDSPIKTLKYIIYLRKTLQKLYKKSGSKEKEIKQIVKNLEDLSFEIEYFEEEELDLINKPIWEIKRRLLIYQQKISF